jgi:hypothetical protein
VPALLASACGGDRETRSRPAAAPPPPDGLAIGLTENNASLLWRAGSGPRLAPELASWRDRLSALRPRYFRLAVDWSVLQPDPRRPPDWELPADGCMRGRPPCAPFSGIRDVLRAVASQQHAGHGFEVLVSIHGVPDWAAHGPRGCEREDIGARSRPITAEGLEGYRRLIRSLAELGRREGATLSWWSAWNEPNGPFFISPQRSGCSPSSAPLAPAVYTRLVRALKAELDALAGDQRLVIGELAGVPEARTYGAGIEEFVAELPDDVVCAGTVYAQHAYVKRGERAADDVIDQLEAALARRPCAKGRPIWITETGVGGPHLGDPRIEDDAVLRADCRALHAAFGRWRDDPRVNAAFQYTFRDDPAFPVGLADAGLRRSWPTYALWRAWGGPRRPDDPPPPLPDRCAKRVPQT